MSLKHFKEWCFFVLNISAADELDKIDEITWKQCISNALKRAHGIFGEQIELYWLRIDDKMAFVKVGYTDKETFKTAIATYVSSSDYVGTPLVISIEQESWNIRTIKVSEEDQLWLNKLIEEEIEDTET
ncbi:Ribonucleases P/MRP protein subunit POP8 [Nakaseomyces bracarensis]|uniref:Ribonucleases P/MRP protein subunit POP8 n=1 Tax=Nakaseomyces bracarensis TaxID=273131 RepID=A0ABR4NT40_9SACH